MNTPSDGFSSSELIYAFLDGQSSETENQQLFTDLSIDLQLQQELREALRLSTLMSKETRLAPPIPVVNSLMQAAGFTTGVVATTTATEAVRSIATGAAAFFFGKQVIDRTLFFILGAVATTGAFLLSFNNRELGHAPGIAQRAIEQKKPSTVVAGENTMGQGAVNTSVLAKQSIDPTYYTERINRDLTITSRDEVSDNRVVNNLDGVIEKNVARDEVAETVDRHETDNAAVIDTASSKGIDDAIAQSPQQPLSENINPDKFTLHSELSSLGWLELGVQGAANLRLFPNREFSQTGTTPMISVELLWNMDDHHAFGLKAGNEIFPIYVLNANENYELRESMMWAGIAYRGFFVSRQSGLLVPYVTASSGITASGILIKSGLGISWIPEQTIALMLEPQWTSLIYRDRGNIHATHKIGFSYGMSYKF